MQQNHDVVDLTGDEVIDLTGGSVFNFDVPSLLTEKAQFAHNVLTRGNTALFNSTSHVIFKLTFLRITLLLWGGDT